MKVTKHISRKQAANLRPAIELAEKLKTPLNQMVSINLGLVDLKIDPWEVSSAFAMLRTQRFGPWIRRPGLDRIGLASTFAWVIENKSGTPHLHWLLHVPASRLDAYKAKLRGWVEECFGPVLASRAIHVQEAYNPYGCRLYFLKGMDPLYAPFYRVVPEDQGTVLGKRFGVSQNLGPSQTRKHGTRRRWRPYAMMNAAFASPA